MKILVLVYRYTGGDRNGSLEIVLVKNRISKPSLINRPCPLNPDSLYVFIGP